MAILEPADNSARIPLFTLAVEASAVLASGYMENLVLPVMNLPMTLTVLLGPQMERALR
jgi:hypothetical protein